MKSMVVCVSQNAVVQAESAILGCSGCTPDARIPFWKIVDTFHSHPGWDAVYILPVLAACPICGSRIDEVTLVEPATFNRLRDADPPAEFGPKEAHLHF